MTFTFLYYFYMCFYVTIQVNRQIISYLHDWQFLMQVKSVLCLKRGGKAAIDMQKTRNWKLVCKWLHNFCTMPFFLQSGSANRDMRY